MTDQELEPPLTQEELKRIREDLESSARAKWLRAHVKAVLAWVAGVIISITLIWDFLKNVIKAAVQ